VERVESEIDEPRGALAIGGRLHEAEGCRAIASDSAQLAIKVGSGDRQRFQRLGGRRVLVRPVEAGARRDELDAPAIDPRVHAVAVEFQFMGPALAFRRCGDEFRELRSDEGGERRIEDAGLPPIALFRQDGAARDGIAGRQTGFALLRRLAAGRLCHARQCTTRKLRANFRPDKFRLVAKRAARLSVRESSCGPSL
jgi:hypothetical protein